MLLFNVIDPGAKDTIKLTIKYMVDYEFNAPAETVNTAIKDLENNQFSVLGLLKGSLTNIILLVSLALLWRLFQKQAFITRIKV
jgi:hypothetical protein